MYSQVRAVQILPTYPLDQRQIAKFKRAEILGSPRLIGLYLASLFVGKKKKSTPGWLRHLGDLWDEADEELSLLAVWQMISESNREQDRRISQMVNSLNVSGKRQYGISLGKFLLLKQRIEHELHSEGTTNAKKEKIETLVDSICQEVCHEIFRLSKLDDQLSEVLTSSSAGILNTHQETLHQMHERIMKAYTVLSETAEQLSIYLHPGPRELSGSQQSDMFDQLLETLRREQEIARSVDQRLREELPE